MSISPPGWGPGLMAKAARTSEEASITRKLIVCADDFAMSGGVSRAIMELARSGKVNAISCMAVSPRWEADALLLEGVPRSVEVGLHLVLTEESPLTEMPCLAHDGRLPSADRLAWLAIRNRLPRKEVAAEIKAQFDRFRAVRGEPPSFVDGHQHTHVLPTIRKLVFQETLRQSPGAWVRSCEDRLGRIIARPFRVKALANAIQSLGLSSGAGRRGLRTNDSFAGLYDFKSSYEPLFRRFLQHPGKFHLVICHPGEGGVQDDPIGPARRREAAALRRLPVAQLARRNNLEFQSWPAPTHG